MTAASEKPTTKVRAERVPLDAYLTPRWMADLALTYVVPHLLDGAPATVLEPGCGSGVLVQAVRDHYGAAPRVYALDIDPARLPVAGATQSGCGDFLASDALALPGMFEPGLRKFDLAIGNPPFKRAVEFLTQAFLCSQNVAFLLRLNFAASNKRVGLFAEYKPYAVWVSPSRPDFTGGGGDYAEYAWFSWRVGFSGNTTLHWLPAVDRAERRKVVCDGDDETFGADPAAPVDGASGDSADKAASAN